MAVMLLSTTSPLQARSPKHSKHAASSNCNYSTQPVRNVILLIGDGMSLAQVSALTLYDGAPEFMKRAQYIGLQTTNSASSDVTDSAAAATALATGTKTRNGMISMTPDGDTLTSIMTRAKQQGMATGLVATHTITDATPIAFVGHNDDRFHSYALAEDFLTSDIDLFIGGGRKYFEKRDDNRNISDELRQRGYTIAYSLDTLSHFKKGHIGLLLAEKDLPMMPQGRGDMLPQATQEALRLLSNESKKGFMLMVEGSHIDNACHYNDLESVRAEIKDFDAAVRIALDFADHTPGTLVIVTGDHETGGVVLPADDNEFTHGKLQPDEENHAVVRFATKSHTGCMVPIYVYGAGAERFSGFMDNTDIPKRIAELLQLP